MYAGASAAELFTPNPGAEKAACCNLDDHLLSCISVKVNADIIFTGQDQDNHDISFNGVKLSFSNPIDPHGKVYKNKQGDEAIINYSKETGEIIGSLRTHDGRSYELETCGDGGDYIFKEFDLTPDPDERDDVVYMKDDVVTHTAHSDSVSVHSSSGEPTEISVMVYYTPAFARKFNGDSNRIALWIDQRFADTNLAFKNSRIHAKVVKFCQEEADIPERSGMLYWFRRYKPGWELLNRADTAALFHVSGGGTAIFNGRISVTSKGDAERRYTYAHELAHNLGAEHDRDNADGVRTWKDNHGHHLRGGWYSTILAYERGTRRIPYFSNPDVRFNGVPTGVSGYGGANNAKTIRNNILKASEWGDEKGTCKGERRTTTRRPRRPRRTTTRRPTKSPVRTTTKRWNGRRTTTPRDYDCLWTGLC